MSKGRPQFPQCFSAENPSLFLTGGSSGIGLACAQFFGAMGIQVLATSREPARAPRLENVQWLELEGSDRRGIERFIDEHEDRLQTVDVAILNAGSGAFGQLPDLDVSTVEEQLYLLMTGPLLLARVMLPTMQQRNSGAIVAVSSLAGQLPLPFMTPYNAAKAGLSAAFHSLRLEFPKAPLLIDLQLGDFRTAFNHNLKKIHQDSLKQKALAAMEDHLNCAPDPDSIPPMLYRLLQRARSGAFPVGSFFQSRLALMANRIFPSEWMLGRLRSYYRIDTE